MTLKAQCCIVYKCAEEINRMRAHSSAGRAPALQAGGHRFEPYCAHHKLSDGQKRGPVVQLVRMPACHAGGRRFEPVPDRQFIFSNLISWCGSTVEQLICNQQVGGSIPSTSSKKILDIRLKCGIMSKQTASRDSRVAKGGGL